MIGLGLYMDREAANREVSVKNCLENPQFVGRKLETSAVLLEKKEGYYTARSSDFEYRLKASETLPVGEKILILAECSGGRAVQFLKFERLGGLRIMKISVSFTAFLAGIFFFFRSFRLSFSGRSLFRMRD